ncbi:Aspartic peptidase [Gossypium australe]|uniref:Aspartic peptidase n=1 Tax=Gossypium australe TaxID=47621 RepID=A0A5B6VYZ6_9ROSI|nr:Aspartic peptidase [Gossypium australe]
MMGDIKRIIGTCIPSNMEDNPWKEDAEITKVPFSSRLEKKQKRDEDKFVSFLNLFKTLNVNLPLIELIEKVPKYAKFLKEMMARRKKIKVLQKLEDPVSFTIPIEIGNIHFNRALCDLGASINLMPLSIFEKLRLRNLRTTQITLQVAEMSLIHLKGVLKDVLFKVRDSIIPIDFVVLDFKKD